MDSRFSCLTLAELEQIAATLGSAAACCRAVGQYALAARVKALSSEANQHLLRREADHRQHVARQMSLVPPGAYDGP